MNDSSQDDRFCCICGQKVEQFLPYRGGKANEPILMSVLELVGSDIDNFSCPNCQAHDRERHLLLYLLKLELLGLFSGTRVLHFAPEQWIAKLIEIQQPAIYIKADLYPQQADIEKVDMLNIQYSDDSFDVVVANHVMEHVDDDLQSLAELHRVLKIGGMAILQTPFSNKLHSTFRDRGINDDVSRLQIYGQEDHVRLYGRDIFSRIEKSGFRSLMVTHDAVLGEYPADIYGVNPKEPLFLFEAI